MHKNRKFAGIKEQFALEKQKAQKEQAVVLL